MSTTNNHSDISIQETPSGVSPTSGDGSAAATTLPAAEGGQTTLDANSPIRTQANVNNVTGEGEQLSLDSNSANNPNVVKPPDGLANSASAGPTVRPVSPRSGNGTRINTEKLDLDAVENAARRTGTYTGALIMTAPVVPIVAALISAIAFIAQWPKGIVMPDWLALFIGTPLLLGTIPTLIAWLLLALLIRRLTAADIMDMRSFGLLLNRLSTLDAQLSSLDPELGGLPPSLAVTPIMASKEALNCRNTICKKLVKRSLMWVTASGYINLWKEMHNAEAALIEIEPREIVIADALYDEMRIQGSNMQTSDELLRKLRKAVITLDPSAENYLQPSATSPQGNSSKLSAENAPTSPQGDSSKLPTENAAANVEP